MPDQAHSAILDRDLFRIQIEEHFRPQLDLLEQLVNYGTNLIPRCYDSTEKKLPDLICLISFLKHAVSCLDAVHILLEKGSVVSSYQHVRTIFEIQIYLRWIFQRDYERRGAAYFVWNTRKHRYWLRCALEGTPEYHAHRQHMKDSLTPEISTTFTQDEIQESIDSDNRKLDAPELRELNALFDTKMKHSGHDLDWYKPLGVSSLRDMAIKLGEEGLYKVFYTNFSQLSHGLSLDHQLHFVAAERGVVYDHIRTLNSLDQVFRIAIPLITETYRQVLKKYRPGELTNFSRKYFSEWRIPFRNVPKVEKKGSTFTVTPMNRIDESE